MFYLSCPCQYYYPRIWHYFSLFFFTLLLYKTCSKFAQKHLAYVNYPQCPIECEMELSLLLVLWLLVKLQSERAFLVKITVELLGQIAKIRGWDKVVSLGFLITAKELDFWWIFLCYSLFVCFYTTLSHSLSQTSLLFSSTKWNLHYLTFHWHNKSYVSSHFQLLTWSTFFFRLFC